MNSNHESNGTSENAQSEEDMHKTSAYVRTVVTLHNLRDKAKDAVETFHEINFQDKVNESWNKTQTVVKSKTRNFCAHPEDVKLDHIPQKYGYVFRPKSCWELVLLGGTVCGIEFCYAAETAFVTPILLGLGLNIKFVTMMWCLSPLIGLIVTPILGSMSDSCESSMGRRRPFILLYSIGILSGLILVSNGHLIGLALGDHDYIHSIQLSPTNLTNERTLFDPRNVQSELEIGDSHGKDPKENDMYKESIHIIPSDISKHKELGFSSEVSSNEKNNISDTMIKNVLNFNDEQEIDAIAKIESNARSDTLHRRKRQVKEEPPAESLKVAPNRMQPWSIAFTVIGTMLLDFCSDACQSPSRTYMLDVSIPDDHAAGLSTFTLMAGLGGSIGYMMGAIQWEDTFLGHLLGSQVSVVFTIVTVVFIICLVTTMCSFPEIPLTVLRDPKMFNEYQEKLQTGNCQFAGHEMSVVEPKVSNYGAVEQNNGFCVPTEEVNGKIGVILKSSSQNGIASENSKSPPMIVTPIDVAAELTTAPQHPTLVDFLKSIVHMPKSLKILCLTNLFCWMSLVCYSLYFTDFVAECVFGGDPQAEEGTQEYLLYKDGVRFGCWGMALYSLSCAVYSYFIEAMVKKIGAKPTYIGGQMVYSIGMVVMAATRHKVAVILLSPTAGVMYATLFTMPYLLIAHYHCTNKFSEASKGENLSIRGIGTDVAAVSSMVFLSQFILSMSMGSIVEAVGSNVATVCAASLLSACGAVCATQVLYLEI